MEPKKSPFLLRSSEVPFVMGGEWAESEPSTEGRIKNAPVPQLAHWSSAKNVYSNKLDQSLENRPSKPKRAFKDFGFKGSFERLRQGA